MYELTKSEVLGLQVLPVADSIVADEVAGLKRRSRRAGRHKGGHTNVCLISLQDSANGIGILNILNDFGL